MGILSGGASGRRWGILVRRAAGIQAQASLIEVIGAWNPTCVLCSAEVSNGAAEIWGRALPPKPTGAAETPVDFARPSAV